MARFQTDTALGLEEDKMNIEPLRLGVYELLILAGIGIGMIAAVVAIVVVMFSKRR